MFGLGVPEIIIIALIILLIFGVKRLPSIGTGLGQTVKEIRNIKKEMKEDKESEKTLSRKSENIISETYFNPCGDISLTIEKGIMHNPKEKLYLNFKLLEIIE